MQHIQDNEFDSLFKDQLGDVEVQPSANLWGRIEPKIAPKKNRSLSMYWAAAAVVLVALSAGILLMQSENQTSQAQKVAAVAPGRLSADEQNIEGKTMVPEHVTANKGGNPVITSEIATKLPEAIQVKKDLAIENKKSFTAMQPVAKQIHHSNTAPVQKMDLSAAQVLELPAAELALTDNDVPAVDNVPVAVVEALTEAHENTEIEQTIRPRIRNAGDLVNFVVEKIDKREQKLVEFRTDDDENSSLVAINIGPFKINQRKSK